MMHLTKTFLVLPLDPPWPSTVAIGLCRKVAKKKRSTLEPTFFSQCHAGLTLLQCPSGSGKIKAFTQDL